MKKYKTPLRYPGGKSRAIKFLDKHIPRRFEKYVEPFLGGGSMALHITQERPRTYIWVNDLYYPVYAFWKTLQQDGERLTYELRELKTELGESIEAHREAFDNAKKQLDAGDVYSTAFNFYILNKCSFSGLSATSSFSSAALADS